MRNDVMADMELRIGEEDGGTDLKETEDGRERVRVGEWVIVSAGRDLVYVVREAADADEVCKTLDGRKDSRTEQTRTGEPFGLQIGEKKHSGHG